jgi:hypothetical protein
MVHTYQKKNQELLDFSINLWAYISLWREAKNNAREISASK